MKLSIIIFPLLILSACTVLPESDSSYSDFSRVDKNCENHQPKPAFDSPEYATYLQNIKHCQKLGYTVPHH